MAKILIADDQVQIRELLRSALSEEGYTLFSVPGLAQASNALATQPFDLVILDLSFPEGSGVSLLEKMRGAQNKVPVVIYSANVTNDLEKELRQAGATEVLNKNVGILPLVGQIRKILEARKRLSEPNARREEKTLLIVDDEASIRHLLREFFSAKRYRIIEAENGEQAVLLARQENPSVALLDVSMPKMDGLTALKKLLEFNPKLGVVMATGNQDDQTVKQAMKCGAYGYVLKPFDLLYLELVVLSKLIIAESVD